MYTREEFQEMALLWPLFDLCVSLYLCARPPWLSLMARGWSSHLKSKNESLDGLKIPLEVYLASIFQNMA